MTPLERAKLAASWFGRNGGLEKKHRFGFLISESVYICPE